MLRLDGTEGYIWMAIDGPDGSPRLFPKNPILMGKPDASPTGGQKYALTTDYCERNE